MSHKTARVKSDKDYSDMLEKKITTDNKNYKYYKGYLKGKIVDKKKEK